MSNEKILEEVRALVARIESQPSAPAPAPAAPAAPPAMPGGFDYAALAAAIAAGQQAQRPAPPSAPSAPSGHSLLPTDGLNPFSLTSEQIRQVGPAGIRKALEALAGSNREAMGLPPVRKGNR